MMETFASSWRYVFADANAYVALFTGVLAVSTFLLWSATKKLWRETKDAAQRQSADTRILERAYIAVNPKGIELFVKGEFYSCEVIFENVGNLPARNVHWFIDRATSDKEVLPEPDLRIVEEGFEGRNVIAPGTKITIGGKALTEAEFESARKSDKIMWIYVWGEVRYADGIGDGERSTKFCHRYNVASARPSNGHFWIKPEYARFHIHGNDAT